MSRPYDVVVAGGGPAGLCVALALAQDGVRTALVTAQKAGDGAPRDERTAALFAGSIEFLRNLGVWDACAATAAPINAIRIVDDLGGLLRSPEISFQARDIGRAVLGFNVPQQTLGTVLGAAAAARLDVFEGRLVVAAAPSPDRVRLELDDCRCIEAPLAIAADGRRSKLREASGVEVESASYPQTAIACSFEHERPHNGYSNELHRPSGPCTTVPLMGRSSSLVWVVEPDEARRLLALPLAEFANELEQTLKGLLGGISHVGARGSFPLSSLRAKPFAAKRIALVGEAAHVIPPIGAQGLNLGLRDGAVLAELVADAVAAGRDPGAADLLGSYDRARSGDIGMRHFGIDLINRSLFGGFSGAQLIRGAGIHALNAIGPLRKSLIREGLEPSAVVSRWLRPLPRTPNDPMVDFDDRLRARSPSEA